MGHQGPSWPFSQAQCHQARRPTKRVGERKERGQEEQLKVSSATAREKGSSVLGLDVHQASPLCQTLWRALEIQQRPKHVAAALMEISGQERH